MWAPAVSEGQIEHAGGEDGWEASRKENRAASWCDRPRARPPPIEMACNPMKWTGLALPGSSPVVAHIQRRLAGAH